MNVIGIELLKALLYKIVLFFMAIMEFFYPDSVDSTWADHMENKNKTAVYRSAIDDKVKTIEHEYVPKFRSLPLFRGKGAYCYGFGERYDWSAGEPIIIPAGWFGTLTIPDVKLDVKIFTGDPMDGTNLQNIVDAPNSCCYVYSPFGDGTILIGDHCTQGFEIIKSLQPGQVVNIKTNNYIDRYEVVFVDHNGVNNGLILFSDGSSAYTGGEHVLNLYTCNEDSDHVTIVHCVKMVHYPIKK